MELFIVCFIIGVIGYFTKAGGYIWKKYKNFSSSGNWPGKQWRYCNMATKPQYNRHKNAGGYKRHKRLFESFENNMFANCFSWKTKCAPGWYNAGCRWRQYGKVVPNTKDDGKLWAVESNHFSLRHSVCYGASYEMAKRIEVAGKDKPEKEEKSERKRRYKEIAGNLYPELKPTLWNADATLIMHFGRYILRNNPGWVRHNLPSNMHERLF